MKGNTMSLFKYKNKLMDQVISFKKIFQGKTKKKPVEPNSINAKEKKESSHQNDSKKPEEFSDGKVL